MLRGFPGASFSPISPYLAAPPLPFCPHFSTPSLPPLHFGYLPSRQPPCPSPPLPPPRYLVGSSIRAELGGAGNPPFRAARIDIAPSDGSLSVAWVRTYSIDDTYPNMYVQYDGPCSVTSAEMLFCEYMI